jgi:hypothetical protein
MNMFRSRHPNFLHEDAREGGTEPAEPASIVFTA